MARLPRFDEPGQWFHVMNRGLARRTVFENTRDVRYFLSRVAYAVRRGELEVHAFSVMTTHFHLLVRSPSGQLSEAMRRIQNEYVRYFNRMRRRDGPLFRGRFLSKPVLSIFYRRILVRYIDDNPTAAGLVTRASDYPHGSAARFASGRIPRWLCVDWVMTEVAHEAALRADADYLSVWGASVTDVERRLVDARMEARGLREDPLDDLVGTAPRRVRDWMVRKARLADGTRPGIPCMPPDVVESVVDDLQRVERCWTYRTPTGQSRSAWEIARTGLLRTLAGQSYRQISEQLGVTTSMIARRARAHEELCADVHYCDRLGRVASLCMHRAFPHAARKVRKRS